MAAKLPPEPTPAAETKPAEAKPPKKRNKHGILKQIGSMLDSLPTHEQQAVLAFIFAERSAMLPQFLVTPAHRCNAPPT